MRESWTDARLDDFAVHVDQRFDRVEADLQAEATAGFEGEMGLAEGQLTLEPPEASFPTSFSLAGEQTVSLQGPTPVTCKTESGVKALGGEGQFESATSGTATLTWPRSRNSPHI